QKRESWVWIWGVAAGIYNPIIPVEASREIWSVVNLASIGLIAFDGIGGARTISCAIRATGRFARTALYFILRLAFAIIMIVVLLLAFHFVITHLSSRYIQADAAPRRALTHASGLATRGC